MASAIPAPTVPVVPTPAPAPPPAGFALREAAVASGLDYRHDSGARGEFMLRETNSGGGGFFDADGDGDPDALLLSGVPVSPGGAPASSVHLYVNDGKGHFANRTAASGLVQDGDVQTFAAADVDGDGDVDVVVAGYQVLRLWLNDGSGRFRDASAAWGLGGFEGFANAAAFVDIERDGRPDLVVGRYSIWTPERDQAANCRDERRARTYCEPWIFPPGRLALYANRGERFIDRTDAAGIGEYDSMALGLLVVDLDRDGRQDIFVANDGAPNLFLRNRGDGTFVDDALVTGLIAFDGTKIPSGMGIDATWPYGDDQACIAVGNFGAEPVTLHCSASDGAGGWRRDSWVEHGHAAGIGRATLPWVTFGLRFADFDLDGHQELIVTNGHVFPDDPRLGMKRAQPVQLFTGADRTPDGAVMFADATPEGGVAGVVAVGRGLATADVDLDGDVDVLMIECDGPARLLVNDTPRRGRSLQLRLVGTKSSVSAFGARVRFAAGDRTFHAVVRSGASYGGESERILTFGLPEGSVAGPIDVDWPSGAAERFVLPADASRVDLEEGRGEVRATTMAAVARGRPSPDLAAALAWSTAGADRIPPSKARAALLDALAKTPEHLRALEALARLELEMGNAPRACELFRRALALAPDRPTLRRELAVALYFARDMVGALTELDVILAAVDEPEYMVSRLVHPFMTRGAIPLADRAAQRMYQLAPTRDDAAKLYAATRLELGDAATAERLAREVLARTPDHGGARGILGYIAMSVGRLDDAAREFRAAIDGSFIPQEVADAMSGLASVLAQQGRSREAADLLTSAFDKRPDSRLAVFAGQLYAGLGDNSAARHIWEKALEIQPDSPPILAPLAALAVAEGRKVDARALLERVLKVMPDEPNAKMMLRQLDGP